MSLFDPQEECPVCHGNLNFKSPGCFCGYEASSVDQGIKPCPKCENANRVHLENRKMVFCGQCGLMEADGVPNFPCVVCNSCGRVPKARARCLHGGEVDGGEEDILEETNMYWTCCGSTYPVDEEGMTLWCQVYLAQAYHKMRMG